MIIEARCFFQNALLANDARYEYGYRSLVIKVSAPPHYTHPVKTKSLDPHGRHMALLVLYIIPTLVP